MINEQLSLTPVSVDAEAIYKFRLLPPPPDVCQECAGQHVDTWPHNKHSIFYQIKFYQTHGRWPTWRDAMAHCSHTTQTAWLAELAARGIDPDIAQEIKVNENL